MSFRPPLPRPRPAKAGKPPLPKRKPGPALTAKTGRRPAPHKSC
jgi:hypothetical protein